MLSFYVMVTLVVVNIMYFLLTRMKNVQYHSMHLFYISNVLGQWLCHPLIDEELKCINF